MADLATETVDTGVLPEVTTSPVVEEGDAVIKSEPQASSETQEDGGPTDGETPEWAVKRFAKLTAQREDEKRLRETAERDREFYRELALKGQTPKAEEIKPEPKPALVAPKIEDFETYDEYLDAALDYRVQQKFEAKTVATVQEQEFTKIHTRFVEGAGKFKEKAADYDQSVGNPAFVQSPALFEAVLSSDIGPALAYHLSKNLAEVDRLNKLSPVLVAREIGRLEERLTPPTPKVVTQAPKPLKPVGGNDTDKVQKDPKDMNMDEYAASRAHTVAYRGRKK